MPKKVRLLLINPRHPESFWSFRWAVDHVLSGKRALNPPLGLATLAALCPCHWEVRIVDENIESIPLDPEADLIGICGMGVQFERQKELLSYYRSKGHVTVAGGSFASLCPERYEKLAHHVIAGEAEYIWKQFCIDFEQGAPQPLYRETGTVNLEDSPTPRFDLLQLKRYTSATLQFSRGCPYLCEFCDIIVMFGRRPRQKSVAQIGRELDALRKAGARSVFFVDDNLIGNRPVARDLLKFLRDYQERHGAPFRFGTEASLNLAQDPEMLTLFHEAGFGWLFVGIESSNPETLKATRKTQNLKEDVLTSVHRIQSYGIDVLGGFIVGFDQDTPETFRQQHQFIMDSGIQAAMVGLLTALPRTPLYERLKKEGRLIETETHDNTRPFTNVIPKTMTQSGMVEAYEHLYRGLLSDEGIAGRVRAKMRHFGKPRFGGEYAPMEAVGILSRLIVRGIIPGGLKRVGLFLHSLPWTRPAIIPAAIADWICGLAMRDYVERRFGEAATDAWVLQLFTASLTRLLARTGATRNVTLGIEQSGGACLALEMHGMPTDSLIARLGKRIDLLLGGSRVRVVLRLNKIHASQTAALGKLLKRLARYGDRIAIEMDEALRSRLAVDSSVFRLVLAHKAPSLPALRR